MIAEKVEVITLRCPCGKEVATINTVGFTAAMFSISQFCGKCRTTHWLDVIK